MTTTQNNIAEFSFEIEGKSYRFYEDAWEVYIDSLVDKNVSKEELWNELDYYINDRYYSNLISEKLRGQWNELGTFLGKENEMII